MAKALGMRIVAEGIELPEQEMFLKLLGVDEGQGYLYSKPMSKEDALIDEGKFDVVRPMAS
jgi:EAL domain-containing protein (putative c-di-GMP-specific phosphodiesterase class I)